MDPLLEQQPGPLRVLLPPAGQGGQIRVQHRLAPAEPLAHGSDRCEPDRVSQRVERRLAGAADSGAPHVGVRSRGGGLLATQHRLHQVHGGEVGEPGHGELGELLARTDHVQRGPDLRARVVEQPEPSSRQVRTPGQSLQLRGVPQGRDAAGRPSALVRRALVDGDEPLTDGEDLVGHDASGGQQPRGDGIEAQFRDRRPVHVRREAEEPACLVVGEQQAAVAAHDDDPLADGVQDRVVVFVHPGHLGGAQAVGLTAQPSADQRRAARGQQEHAAGCAEEERELLLDDATHVLDGDTGGDHADHGPVACRDRDDRLDERSDGAGDALGEHLAGPGIAEVADEFLPDPVGQRMGVADALGVHHDDEVDTGTLAGRLRLGLEHRGGIGALQCLLDPGGVGESLGDGDRPVTCLAFAARTGLEHERRHGRGDEQHHDRHLQEKDLTGDSSHPQNRARAAVASGHRFFLHLRLELGEPRTEGRGRLHPRPARGSSMPTEATVTKVFAELGGSEIAAAGSVTGARSLAERRRAPL
jgi:hypothetical protein